MAHLCWAANRSKFWLATERAPLVSKGEDGEFIGLEGEVLVVGSNFSFLGLLGGGAGFVVVRMVVCGCGVGSGDVDEEFDVGV